MSHEISKTLVLAGEDTDHGTTAEPVHSVEPMINLFGVCWYVTTDCVIAGRASKCDKCFALQHLDNESLEVQMGVVDALAIDGIRKLSFGGQEPLLVPHLPNLIRRAKEYGMITALFTTGIGLEKRIDEIEPYLDHLALPLDGSNPELNAKGMAGNTRHFDVVTGLIPKMLNRRFNLEISTTVTRHNLHDLVNLGFLMRSLGVRIWKVFQFVPLENGQVNQHLGIDQDDFLSVGRRLQQMFPDLDIDLQVGDAEKLGSYFIVAPNGDAYGTTADYQHVRIGNVVKTSAQKLWAESSIFSEGRDRHHERFVRDRPGPDPAGVTIFSRLTLNQADELI